EGALSSSGDNDAMSVGSSPSSTLTLSDLPLRQMVISTLLPGSIAAIFLASSRGSLTASPLTAVTTSPASMPALAAGAPSCGCATRGPLASDRPRDSALSAVTGWICTPGQPRPTDPSLIKSLTTVRAVEAGIAKAIPTLPPEG